MDSGKRLSRKGGRAGLTKEMLLPLPAEKVRSLSLEHHLALAAIRSGHGDSDQISCLLKAVYLAFFMRDAGVSEAQIAQFRRAEQVLERCIERVERGERWWLLDTERGVLERVLVLHDEQLAAVPTHRYLAAWTQLRRFIVGAMRSPIPRL
ncbi:hypothetical protein [Burkholderia ambifaria]|uniref:Fis family transcriptional regulator n=1 Tax=Burkholderia ambifaria MEX-5 TaxID=396597 RepID=B1TFQ9_9BURK|nr:hypothetical protein [Burkholderia ambifaria]EDT37599.1 conserved hypothetical protein [Burkholderia ambifaria MEX-5]